MLVQLAVGLVASSANIMIHSWLMAFLIRVARGHAAGVLASSWQLARLMSSVVCMLMLAHLAEVAVWAVIYGLVGAAPTGTGTGTAMLDFAFVNYTTLGYGNVLPVDRWRLLGPFTAMNGILLFGWSTAVIFEVLRRALARMDQRLERSGP